MGTDLKGSALPTEKPEKRVSVGVYVAERKARQAAAAISGSSSPSKRVAANA